MSAVLFVDAPPVFCASGGVSILTIRCGDTDHEFALTDHALIGLLERGAIHRQQRATGQVIPHDFGRSGVAS